MKIRKDFVTNSSSSSYIIAYKAFPNLDDKLLQEFPILKGFDAILERVLLSADDYGDTTEGECIRSVEELDKHFVDCYGYADLNTLQRILDDDHYLKEHYEKCAQFLKNGYNIVFKQVDYSDTTFDAIVRSLSSIVVTTAPDQSDKVPVVQIIDSE